eukprot:sb/3463004/
MFTILGMATTSRFGVFRSVGSREISFRNGFKFARNAQRNVGGFLISAKYIYKCENECIGFRIVCEGPINSTKEWSCTASYSISDESSETRDEGKHIFAPGRITADWNTTFPWDQAYISGEKGDIGDFSCFGNADLGSATFFEIVIDDIFIGTPTLTAIIPNSVTFTLNVRNFTTELLSTSHVEDGMTWQVEGYKEKAENHKPNLNVRLVGSYRNTYRCGYVHLVPMVVIILNDKGNPTIKTESEGKWVQFKAFNDDPDKMLTFVIYFSSYAQGYTYNFEPVLPKRFDFERENISVPAHGNASFTLKDGSTIAANSFILAYNSPVLKKLFEEAGEIEHDVSDFEPEAVRIFVDVCYSGKLDIINDKIWDKVDYSGFKAFSDFVKMIAVFKVDWAFAECSTLYGLYGPIKDVPLCPPQPFLDNNIRDDSGDGYNFWEWALLALKLSVKFGNYLFLDLVKDYGSLFNSEDPEDPFNAEMKLKREDFLQQIPELLVEITQRSHLDLVMVLVVEWGFEDEFLHDLLTLLKVKAKIPLLKYLLETFNLSGLYSYSNPKLNRLNTVLIKSFPSNGGWIMTTNYEVCEKDVRVLELDGTLATIARNRWYKIKDSNWPCSEKRPFYYNKRDLPDLCY